jgi:predicted ATP-grasp superfamily ATP-dependent carboligase
MAVGDAANTEMPDAPSLIVVAQSARALATSAKRAGYVPLAVDLFGDDDTRAISRATIVLEGGLSRGLRRPALIDGLRSFVRDYGPTGLVYGAGLEHQPALVAELAREVRVYGANMGALSRAKEPVAVALACAQARIAHPQIEFERPVDCNGWLKKLRGGAGGGHVRIASEETATPGYYFQRRVDGRSVSALFLGDGARANIVGLSEQWTSPCSRAPFRYGGAVGPIEVGPDRREEIESAVAGVTRAFGLVGLASADFIVADDVAWFIEANPRPGATLDLFDRDEDPLLARHIEACEGRMATPAARTGGRAAEIVYATSDIACPPWAEWPDWVADRPTSGTHIAHGEPICTVFAAAPDAEAARRLVAARAQDISVIVEGWTT